RCRRRAPGGSSVTGGSPGISVRMADARRARWSAPSVDLAAGDDQQEERRLEDVDAGDPGGDDHWEGVDQGPGAAGRGHREREEDEPDATDHPRDVGPSLREPGETA